MSEKVNEWLLDVLMLSLLLFSKAKAFLMCNTEQTKTPVSSDVLFFSFFKVFIYLKVRIIKGKGKSERDLPSTNSFLKWLQWPKADQPKPGFRNLFWVSHVGSRGQSI